jgi:hypothetical protein
MSVGLEYLSLSSQNPTISRPFAHVQNVFLLNIFQYYPRTYTHAFEVVSSHEVSLQTSLFILFPSCVYKQMSTQRLTTYLINLTHWN